MNKNEYWPGASERVVSVIHRSMTGGENRFTRNKIGLPSALMTTRCRESAMTAPKQMIREKKSKEQQSTGSSSGSAAILAMLAARCSKW